MWGIYFAAAELCSNLPSYSFSCVLVSDEDNTKDYSGNQPCAPMHEAIFRLLKFLWAKASPEYINAFAAVAVAVFTFTLWRSTLKLWKAGEKQIAAANDAALAANRSADIAENALIAGQGAFVFVKNCIFNGITDPTTNRIVHWKVNVVWENSGETPTRYLKLRINREVPPLQNSVLPDDFTFPDSPAIDADTPALIGPNATIDSTQLDVTLDEMTAIRDGGQCLYLWGWAEYDNVFLGTPRRRTEFCYRIFVMGDPSDPAPNKVSFRWSLHKTHNGADDECMQPIKTGSPKNPRSIT
jgi:hypothetical protein